MKSIDVKSLLIGFLLCSCFFLFTAQSQLQKMLDKANYDLLNKQLYPQSSKGKQIGDMMYEAKSRSGILPGRFTFIQDNINRDVFHILDTENGRMFIIEHKGGVDGREWYRSTPPLIN